jgi:hypothetical protein
MAQGVNELLYCVKPCFTSAALTGCTQYVSTRLKKTWFYKPHLFKSNTDYAYNQISMFCYTFCITIILIMLAHIHHSFLNPLFTVNTVQYYTCTIHCILYTVQYCKQINSIPVKKFYIKHWHFPDLYKNKNPFFCWLWE